MDLESERDFLKARCVTVAFHNDVTLSSKCGQDLQLQGGGEAVQGADLPKNASQQSVSVLETHSSRNLEPAQPSKGHQYWASLTSVGPILDLTDTNYAAPVVAKTAGTQFGFGSALSELDR